MTGHGACRPWMLRGKLVPTLPNSQGSAPPCRTLRAGLAWLATNCAYVMRA